MIAALNRLVDLVDQDPAAQPDLAALAREHGSTEYHLRRMFSSLAGMPLSEYLRRRRMTLAAADVVAGEELLGIAVRHGYGSAEAFGRAFRAVHGTGPTEVRRDGGPLRTQTRLRFRLSVEGDHPMDVTLIDLPDLRLVGHAVRVPLLHHGVNPRIAEHVAGIAPEEHARLNELSDARPAGLLAVTDDVDPDAEEGSELTYLHGVSIAAGTTAPPDLDLLTIPAGAWAVFHTEGPHPDALQRTWAATATDWFPSQPWRLRPGPSILAVLDAAPDWSRAICDLWLPVERD